MVPILSTAMSQDIAANLHRIEREALPVNAFTLAALSQAHHPDDNVAIEDIVEELITLAGGMLHLDLEPPPTMEVALVDREPTTDTLDESPSYVTEKARA